LSWDGAAALAEKNFHFLHFLSCNFPENVEKKIQDEHCTQGEKQVFQGQAGEGAMRVNGHSFLTRAARTADAAPH
jgi:hypothetical protein